MRHPDSQRFYQSDPFGGGGGGAGIPEMGIEYPPAPAPGAAPLIFRGQTDYDRRRAANEPLPVHPNAMTDKQLTAAWKAGKLGPEGLRYLQQRVANLKGGATPQDMEYGAKVKVPAPGGEPGEGGGWPAVPRPPEMIRTPGRAGKYSRADVQRFGGLAERRKAQAVGFMGLRDKITQDLMEQTKGWLWEARAEQQAAGLESSQAREKYTKAAKSLAASREQLASLKIDPDRYWRNMPSSQKTLWRLRLFFGGLAEGFSDGRLKSAAMQMLMGAQKRDMEAQRINYQKLVQQAGLDERAQDVALRMYDKSEMRRRMSGLQVMKLQLSRMGLQEKQLGHKERYADLINGVDAQMYEILRQSRGTGGGLKQNPLFAKWYQAQLDKEKTREALQAKAQFEVGGGKGDRGEEGARNAIGQIDSMIKSYKGKAWATVFGQPLTDDAADYMQKKGLLGLSLWRMFDSGKLSDSDREQAYKLFFPDARRALWERTKGIDVRQMLRLKVWLKAKVKPAGTYKNPKMSPEAKARWAQQWGLKPEQL